MVGHYVPNNSSGVYLVQGGVPGPRGVHLVPGGCTWSQGGAPGPRGGAPGLGGVHGPVVQGVHLVQEGVPGPGGCTWSGGVPGLGGCTWSGTPPCEQNHTHP